LDFDGLRKEGIELVQEMSGDVWTDYNLHDPGVTILEVLCYALTDLAYRSGFGAADYLASAKGGIDFEKLALYRPDEVFSSRAVTDNDYRKLILGSVPNIDNVWVQRQEGELQGLYRIYVQLNDRVKNQGEAAVRNVYISTVEKVYSANRNLCEDLAELEIVERIPYSLRGEIEVDGKREPADVLAEIYYECAQYLSPKVPIHSYAEMYKSGRSLEELFSGVLTKHGYIAEEELHPWRGDFSISDLIGKIGGVEGVQDVKRLVFVDGDGKESDCIRLDRQHSCRSVASLSFPPPDGVAISLQKAGKAYPVSLSEVEAAFSRLDYNSETLRRRKQNLDWVGALMPSAVYRNFHEYYSIQNHFPAIYGLNVHGVPDSAPPERKAQAMQLKAYLLFFEQVMANFLQNLQEIPRLFSLDGQLGQSYFHQVLRNDAVPSVESVYSNGVGQMEAELAKLVAGFDNHGDRRNRVLDYLLGLYGERLGLTSLRQFMEDGASVENERIESKIAFLSEIVDTSKNRAAGFDYRKATDEDGNGSGLKKKLQILLGLKTAIGKQDRYGDEIQVVEHILLRPRGKETHGEHQVPDGFYSFKVSIIFPSGGGRFADTEFHKLAEETVYLNCPAHIHPEMFWLDPEQMSRFAALHDAWLEAKRVPETDAEKSDAAAAPLIGFLLEMGEKHE
jgi:hypothetical protein